jgi:putative transposase
VRYGYRRVHVHLRRDGWKINMKKTRRIYSELGLQLRNKHPKRRVKAKLRDDRQEAVGPNDVWAMDFVHDQLATGKKLRILTVVDTHSRYCPAADARFTYRGEDVVQTLEGICRKTGYPKTIRVAVSSSPVISTCGPMPTTSPWTSHVLANRLITASSRRSTASSGPNA